MIEQRYSHDNYSQSLLDEFSEPNKEPTIAVSVDMLDTGVDVPEVVNLVFFKPVYSRVKFNQMIGRKTRLCPDVFGIGQHKEQFLIFDLCSNFDYFNQEIVEQDPKPAESISAKLVKARLGLSQAIAYQKESQEDDQQLRTSLLNDLHQHVATMEKNNFLVRRHLQQVEEFSERDRWNQLSESDTEAIAYSLAHLPNGLPKEDELPNALTYSVSSSSYQSLREQRTLSACGINCGTYSTALRKNKPFRWLKSSFL